VIIIRVRDLKKSYGSVEVLKGLNLDIFEGETLVILGRSGVGKSVLLKQIIGLEMPDAGSVEVDGRVMSDSVKYQRDPKSKRIGMLFQGSALFDSMTVTENTAYYLRQHEPHLSEKILLERVDNALEMVGLEEAGEKIPSDLSGGMRKRAALARLIVYRPQIILYDEPTTGLDPITAMQINELINKTQRELQATSVVVTHDIRSAMEVGDRLAFHHDGTILLVAPKEEFMQTENPLVQSFFANAILSNDYLINHKKMRTS
jgi:phospholipid/cholesterol/gamma-HCH transport system ATP-binding protein